MSSLLFWSKEVAEQADFYNCTVSERVFTRNIFVRRLIYFLETPRVIQMTDRVKVKARFNGIARRFEISSPTSWEELTFQVSVFKQEFLLAWSLLGWFKLKDCKSFSINPFFSRSKNCLMCKISR